MTPSAAGAALVTGGSGFLGRALCARLQERGATVRVVARRAAEGPWDSHVAADLATSALPAEALDGVDTIFHLAAKAHAGSASADDDEHWAVTVEGTRRVVNAAARASVRRFVFVSSVKAAGDGGDALVDEEFDPCPVNAYGRAKREAEKIVLRTAADAGMHAAVLRPALIYGPGWKGNLSRMFRAVEAGRFLPPPETGNRRSMVHVADVAEAALLAAGREQAAGRVYILADGEPYSTRRIYEAMCRAVGRTPLPWHVPRPLLQVAARTGDVLGRAGRRGVPFDSGALDRLLGSAWYDASRARRELGWLPSRTLEEALPEIAASERSRASGRPRSTANTYRQFRGDERTAQRLRTGVRDGAVTVLSASRSVPGHNWIRFPYYHHVFDDQRAGFEAQLRWMKSISEPISLDEAAALLDDDAAINGRYFCVTFDDGYKSCVTNALPILAEQAVPAAFFVPTAFVGAAGGERHPNLLGRITAYDRFLTEFLDWDDCRRLVQAGMTVGSHTVTHPRLVDLPAPDVERELLESKQTIERRLGEECRHFACPKGRPGVDFLERRDTNIAARLGYRSFLTTRRGGVHQHQHCDPMLIPRDHVIASWSVRQLQYFFSR